MLPDLLPSGEENEVIYDASVVRDYARRNTEVEEQPLLVNLSLPQATASSLKPSKT